MRALAAAARIAASRHNIGPNNGRAIEPRLFSRGIIWNVPAIAFLTADERRIDPVDVRRLYDGADWWPDWQPESIRALSATTAIGAWDGDRLIGFTRALSDGVHRAYVEDVVIDPEYR